MFLADLSAHFKIAAPGASILLLAAGRQAFAGALQRRQSATRRQTPITYAAGCQIVLLRRRRRRRLHTGTIRRKAQTSQPQDAVGTIVARCNCCGDTPAAGSVGAAGCPAAACGRCHAHDRLAHAMGDSLLCPLHVPSYISASTCLCSTRPVSLPTDKQN